MSARAVHLALGVACSLLLAGGRPRVWAHSELSVLERAARAEAAGRPEDPGVHLQEGYVLEAAGDWDGALAAFAHAAAHGADRDEVGAARGRVMLASGRPALAKREFDGVLRRRPDRVAVLFARGRASWQLGRPEAAARDFGRAVAGMASPTPEHVFVWRDALLALERPDAALRALDQSMAQMGPVPSLELAAIDLELQLGRPEEALARVDRLLATSPRNEAWIARRGELLARVGRVDEARADFQTALTLIAARPPGRRGTRIETLERRLRAGLGSGTTPTEETP